MLEGTYSNTSENNILYELLIYSEWQQEPEVQSKGISDRNDENLDKGYIHKWLGPFAPQPCPPLLIRALTSVQMPWKVAIGGNGAVIAVLQDTSLEIRTSRDEYGAVIGRTQVTKDPYPQWSRILWSPDCSMLALAHSNGKLDFYDLIGAHMFTIEPKVSATVNGKPDFRLSVADMAFCDVRIKNTQWSYELLIANYQGTITGYYISPSDGYKESHTFSLSSCYPMGITCFSYNPLHNIFIVCGKSHKLSMLESLKDSSQKPNASQMGISAWRIISGPPYYKLAMSIEEQHAYSKTNWWNILSQYNLYKVSKDDLVFKMSTSPNGQVLAAIHSSGALSLWELPSLRLRKFWGLELQPNYADRNPQYCEPGMKKKLDHLLSDPLHSHIIDINWWSNEAVIIVRRCGAVTVSSIDSLQNLLGISPEWFEPSPAVTSFCDRGFLAVECENKVKSKRRTLDEIELEDDESSDDEDPSIFAYTYGLAQRALYFVTDNDRFQPPRKKMKMMTKTYRLLCLKSTTPEELYTRKINNEEYGDALALAKTYDLDCDLVYQRQWRKMPATVESIHDYLSKITKRSWVLHECMERVPESFEAAKELLLYGLQGTDLKALIAIGKGEDHGRFILCSPYDEDDDPEGCGEVEEYGENAEELYKIKKKCQQKKMNELLKQVNFKKLTLEQKQLCQCRLKLLAYLDRLTTYEIILGGPMLADEHYNYKFFKQLRSQCGLEAAIHFACNSNWEAVATLFTYHGTETLPHRLAILSNFPETSSPIEYQSLLPLFNEHELVFYPWDEHQLREPDWCETKYQKNMVIQPSEDFVQDFYEKYNELLKYRQPSLASAIVTEWFIERAKDIERRSGLVDNALELVRLGIQRNIQGLEKLYDDLITLENLIYDCLIEKDLSLQEYEELTEFEKVKLIMSTTSEENFIKNVKQWLLPFLNRCDKYDPGCGKSLLKSYILSISKNDLSYCKKILESSYSDPTPIMSDVNELISLGLDCVYYCERNDQLKNSKVVYELLVSLPDMFNKNSYRKFHGLPEDVENLRKHISVAQLLDKNGLAVTLSIVQNISKNPEEVKKLLTKLTRMASHRFPVLDEAEWTTLLSDILDMQKILFKCVSKEDCFEIVLHSLLCSGKSEGIKLAGKMMECNNKLKKEKQNVGYSFKLPYLRAVNLVLMASQEYFNSSANAGDPCMALARSCLNLIEDVPASIEEELDLISSISLLQEFNVTALPLQVRLRENRMDLVQEALQRKDKSYKKFLKIMKLAHLLRAGSSNTHEREGTVLALIGERAFQAKDFKECLSACEKLMEGGHKEGWLICYTLGGCNEFDNIPARSRLMSFSLAYCSEDLIETILKSRSELQLQVLQERVRYLVGDNAVNFISGEPGSMISQKSEVDVNGMNALWHTSERTLQVLQTTTQTTKAVLTSVKSVQFWKDAVNWIQPLGIGWNKASSDVLEEDNKNLSKQGICGFYDGLIENAHISTLEANYERYARPDLDQPQEIAFCILRASLLEDSLKYEASLSCLENSVLLDMTKAYLPQDIVFSLSILLSLREADDAEVLLETLPSTPLVLQFASLYYAIKIYLALGLIPFNEENGSENNPATIIRKALDMKTSDAPRKSDCGEGLWNLLEKYDKRLYDFIQAEILHSIGGGVDATRFTTDDVYKKDTILGISMTPDDNVFHIAVSLAHHYNISVWDLYMTHLEYLFSESSVPASMIIERAEKLKLIEKLLDQKENFELRLKSYVYPSIDGKDHEKLTTYFSFLEACGDNEDDIRIKPSLHKELLKKFKAVVKSIDYKAIMSPESSQSYISNILNESNVGVFAEEACNIPKQGDTFYEPGNICCLWIQKYFFEGDSTNSQIPLTKTEWVRRYESCTDMLQRLGSRDVISFVDCIIFSEKSLEKMNIDCRSEVVKRLLNFSRKKFSKAKSDFELSSQWNATVSILTSYFKHLQRLEDEILVQLRESFDPKIKAYCKDFDLSKSLSEKLQNLLARIVLEGPDLQLLKTFLSCCPANVGWEPADAYIKAINVILAQMKKPQSSSYTCFKTLAPIHILETILQDISSENCREELMLEDTAVGILNEFCQDVQVSISVRLSILQLLEKTNCLSAEYGDLLLLYRTQAVVSSMWPNLEVSEEEVQDDFQRKILFDTLLSLCKTVNHFNSIAKLLSYWPSFSQSESWCCDEEPWTKLLHGLISISNKDALNTAVSILDKALTFPSFNEKCYQTVFQKIQEQGSILHTLKCALKTNYKTVHLTALQILKDASEINAEDYDDELLELILEHCLTSEIVSTGLYKPVIEFLLHCQDDNHPQDSCRSIDSVVKELHKAGFESEAGSLLLIKNSTHTGLSTFSSTSNVLQRWLSATKTKHL